MVPKKSNAASNTRLRSFADQSTVARTIGVVIAPAVLGIASGLLLGVSAAVYWIVQIVAVVGGFFGGAEHAGWRAGILRGLVGGAVFGAAALVVRALTGWSDKVDLGKTPAFLVVLTAIAGALIGALGVVWAARRRP